MPASLDNILDTIESGVARRGWSATAVLQDPERGTPTFSYSIGFAESYATPEIVLLGLEPRIAQSIVASVATSLKGGELRLPPAGGRLDGILRGYPALVRPVAEPLASQIARFAAARTDPGDFRLLQILYPDPEGRLPDDPECDSFYIEIQDYAQLRD